METENTERERERESLREGGMNVGERTLETFFK